MQQIGRLTLGIALIMALIHADLFAQEEAKGHLSGADGQRSEYLVPVVVHIIHYDGAENIGDAQVHDAIRILNEDFNRQNPNWQSVHPQFLDLVANVGIEFRLAKLDPDGNCTNGITRTISPLTFTGYQPMRDLIQWPPGRYMNVWVHAYLPGTSSGLFPPPTPDMPVLPAQAEQFPASDGVMMYHAAMGSIGTSSNTHAHALTHRVGHWLNLIHPWGPGNSSGNPDNCQQDDEVEDTPRTTGVSVNCNMNQTTCDGLLDNVENFMDYGVGNCPKMFTPGQKERMLAALTSPISQRNNLITEANHLLTGMHLPDVLCKAALRVDRRQVCIGEAVNFLDMSYHGITERWWNFPGGSPATSTDPAPLVMYNEAGLHDVQLTVTDGVDTLTVFLDGHIEVIGLPGGPTPTMEGFELHNTFFTHPWSVYDPDENGGWSITESASFSGLKSAWCANDSSLVGQVEELISPPLDMTDASHFNITFKYAFAKRNELDQDRLRVYSSNDCGVTWQTRATLSSWGTLNTGGIVTSDFVPTISEWGTRDITNISYPSFSDAVRIRFRFERNGGNHLYLDDINIHVSTVGVEDRRNALMGTSIVPNPATAQADLWLTVARTGPISITIYDAVGRAVLPVFQGSLKQGEHLIELPIERLGPGTYLVRISDRDDLGSLRLVVQ